MATETSKVSASRHRFEPAAAGPRLAGRAILITLQRFLWFALKPLAILLMVPTTSNLNASPKRPYVHEIFGEEMMISWLDGQHLHERAMDLYYSGKYVAAEQALDHAIDEAEVASKSKSKDVAILLTTKAQGILLLGNIREAEALLDKALVMALAVVPSDDPVIGRIEFVRVAVLLLRGDHAGMQLAAEKANLSLSKSQYVIPHAMALRASAVVNLAMGKLKQASSEIAASSKIINNSVGKDGLLYAENQVIQAVIFSSLGNYEEAIRLCEAGLQTLTSCVGSQHELLLNARSVLADNYQLLGLYSKALPLLKDNLRTAEITLGEKSFVLSSILNSIGLLQYRMGNFTEAEEAFRQCLVIRGANLGDKGPAYGTTVNNLALVFQEEGKWNQTSTLFRNAAEALDKSLGTNSPALATTLLNWGNVSRSVGDSKSARGLITEALAIDDRVFGKNHPSTADALEALARLECDVGNFRHAAQLEDVAYPIKEEFYGKDHPALADSLRTQATIRSGLGDPIAAAELLGRSALIGTKALGLEHPTVGNDLERAGRLLASAGELDTAANLMAMSLQSQRDYQITQYARNGVSNGSSTSERMFYRIEILNSLTATSAASASNIAKLAEEQLCGSKALMEEVETAAASLEADPRSSIRDAKERVISLRNQLARLSKGSLAPIERETLREQLQTDLNHSEEVIAGQNLHVAQLVRSRRIELAEIAPLLPPQSALIDFIRFRRYDFSVKTNHWKDSHYAVYLTFPLVEDSTNAVVERVNLGEASTIDDAVATVMRRMSAGQYRARDLQAAMADLSRLVYAPLAKYLTNVSHLIVCPDGQLSRLPFEMLKHNGRYLIEDKTISYVTSGREIIRLAQPRDVSKTGPPLVMGNPDFNLDLGGSRREEVASSTSIAEARTPDGAQSPSLLTSAATRMLSRDFRGAFKFAPLPGSEIEATQVAKLLGGNTVLWLGAAAREAELKRVVSPRVLEIATHGFFLPDQERKHPDQMEAPLMLTSNRPWSAPASDWENPMIRCGLALAGANHAGAITNAAAEDGILTGLEAALLNLQGTELVILSACDSGTGEVKIGEGVMSLRRAFRIAGAETVLASHWPISDRATGRLMTEFMRRWQAGESRAAAWREAQLSLLHSNRASDDFSDPYFWAAFTLTGQWRK